MENKSFEELMQELDNILKTLDTENISLDDAIKNYTKGLEVSKQCYDILNKSEELVVKQMTENGLEDFKRTE